MKNWGTKRPSASEGEAGSAAPARRRPLSSRRQRALMGSETSFRLLVESVEDYAIFMLDPKGRVATWNPGAERIKGYAAEEILGQHFSVFYPPESRAQGVPKRALRDATHLGRFEDEGWRLQKGGNRFWANVVITAVRDPEGELLGFAKVTRDLTARRLREQELEEQQALFEELADNIRDVLWIADPGLTRIRYVNPAYEELTGRSRESLYRDPTSWLESVHPADRMRVKGELETAAERETSIAYRLVRADGVRWVRVRAFPVRDEEGVVYRLVGVSEDITARREREESRRFLAEAGRILAASLDFEETLRRVVRLAVPRIADWCAVDVREDGHIRRLQVAHEDPEKLELAMEVSRRYPPDPDAPSGIPQVLRTGEPELYPEVPAELLRAAAHDEEHYRILNQLGLRSAMVVPLTARGRTLGALTFVAAESGRTYGPEDLVFAQEIASRAALSVDNARLLAAAERRAREEAALRQATEAMAGAFTVDEVIRQIATGALNATGGDGAFVLRIDIEKNQVVVAEAAGTIVPAKGVASPYPGSYVQSVIESRSPEVIARLASSERTVPAEIVEACGSCSAVVVPLLDAGEAIGALTVLRHSGRPSFSSDEVERAFTFADLAALAFRKVHLLQESEGRREELERVVESRARLMRGFSHDLRNPLGVVESLLSVLQEKALGELTEPQLANVARARRALHAAVGLVDDLLELAHAEAGQIEIRHEAVDIREIAAEMTEEYRPQAQSSGLTLELHLPEELPVVAGDATRVRQVLGNLISNAVKYTPRGGRVGVRVEARQGEGAPGDGEWITVEIADSGPGIPRDKQEEIFQEFTRLEGAASQGLGVGLAISRRIAQLLGGDVTLESEHGHGSAFTLWLPR